MIQKNQRSIICAHLNSTINHSGSHGWGHHFNHGNIQSCSLQGRGTTVRRARPQGGMRGRLISFTGRSRNSSSEQRSELLLDHKPCLVHGPCLAPPGGGGAVGVMRQVTWDAVWCGQLPAQGQGASSQAASPAHRQHRLGTGLSLLRGHDQLCIQRER